MDSQSFSSARDIVLLYQQSKIISSCHNNSPNALHIAVALGLPNFVREIVDRSPELALSFDEHGLTPCHLAVANCHISVLKELLDSKVGTDICCLRDAKGNTLLHLAVATRKQEIVKMLVGKVDLNAVNLNGSTALDIYFDLGHEHEDKTIEKMISRADGIRAIRHDASQHQITKQPEQLELEESKTQPCSPETGINIFFQLWGKLLNFRRVLSRRAPNKKDIETSNTLMIVATLVAAITFQSALNPPGGFIQDEEDRGMAVLESYLSWYLLFDMVALISSLSVILLTVYVVPKWKDLIKVAMFIVWVSVFFTFMSFHFAITYIFGHLIRHPLIMVTLSIGYGMLLVFAFSMFIYSWYLFYRSMSMFLAACPTKRIVGRSKIFGIACIAFLGAAIVWLPFVVLDIGWYSNMF